MVLKNNPPKYQQIINFIKGKITNGEWPIGSKIPSQRLLAKRFEVNRSTIITALEDLMADGLIEAKIGLGTYVVNNTWTLLATNPPPDWDEHVKSGLLRASQSTVQEINMEESKANLIQLSKGELSKDLFPLETMKSVLGRVTDQLEAFGYEEPKGFLPLREALSDYLKTIGIQASPSSILIVSGALQALQLISVGLLHRGSSILLEQPSYLYSLHVFQSAGMKLTGLPSDEYGLIPSSISISNKQRNRAILYSIPCFHNPTGILMPEKRRQELLSICQKEQLPMIEDDVYRELWLDEIPPSPIKAHDKHGHVLYLGSLSKSLSPGLRIGWIVGPEPVIERLSDIKMQTDYGSSSISQRVAAEWFKSGLYEQHLVLVREELKKRRTVMLETLEYYLSDIASWYTPKGGFFIWLKISSKIPMKELYVKALAKGILLNPGSIYGQDTNRLLRLSYSYASITDLKKGIYQISQIIRELIKR